MAMGIYKITNLVNGKFYIGSTSNFQKRKREHRSGLITNTHFNNHLQHAFNKYGIESFSFEVVEHVDNIGDLLDVEQKYLDELNPCDMEIGYNLSRCATSYRVCGEDNPHFGVPKSEEQKRKTSESLKGHKHSKETKQKISKAVKGKNTGEDHWSYGKERSQQHRERLSESMKGKFLAEKNPFYGKKHSAETKIKMSKPVVQLSKDGTFIAEFQSVADAEKIGGHHVSCCCTGKRKTAGGYKWMYLEEYETSEALK